MSFTDSMNGLSPSDIAAVVGNNDGFGGNNAWWLIILFLFAFNGNGWGNRNDGCCNQIQEGFNQNTLMGELNSLNNTINNGFATAEMGRRNDNANILQTMNSIAMNQLQNCYGLDSGIKDLKYTIASENCADRTAIAEGVQSILTKLSQQEIEAKNDTIANLRAQLNMASLAASQNAQTSAILNDNTRQTLALEQYLNPPPIPAYYVANPHTSYNTYPTNGCGC